MGKTNEITLVLESNDSTLSDYLDRVMRFNKTNSIGMFNRTWVVESFDVRINRASDMFTLGSRDVIRGTEMGKDITIKLYQTEAHSSTGLRL